MRVIDDLPTDSGPRSAPPPSVPPTSATPSKLAQRADSTGVTTPMTVASCRSRMVAVGARRRAVGVVGVVVLGLVLTGSTAHADTVVLALAASVDEVLTNVRNWIMGIAAGVATVFMSIGGARRMMGGGDPAEIEKSKIAFKSAGMGYALAALAPLAVEILKGIVGA